MSGHPISLMLYLALRLGNGKRTGDLQRGVGLNKGMSR